MFSTRGDAAADDAVDVHALADQRLPVPDAVSAIAGGARVARGQPRQRRQVPTVQRQVFDLLEIDHLSNGVRRAV